MTFHDEMTRRVQRIINRQWNTRKGISVPTTSTVALAGGAVEMNATFLYADLAYSSNMAKEVDRRVAAKIIKSFLCTTCKLIRSQRGKIVSFDGDRVLGVFVGHLKNLRAVRCGLHINYVVQKIIRPRFERQYDSVLDVTFPIMHGIGIDSGTVIAVRAGVRGSNDLIWIGRPPNLAAKLSDIREWPYTTYITAGVYNDLNDLSKYSQVDKQNMWQRFIWTFLNDKITLYRSDYIWKP